MGRGWGPSPGLEEVDRITTKLRERFELRPEAVAMARRSLAPLKGLVPDAQIDDVRLMVSELVTNCIRHAGLGPPAVAVLTVEVEPERVHVEVEDHGKGFGPLPIGPRPGDREAGWGLAIVERLADRWGIDDDRATVVWFDLELRNGARL